MKTTPFLMIVIVVMASFFAHGQGAVGIGTSNPRSTLEINGTLRVDSTKPINNPKRIAVLSDSNTVDYISTDSLMKLFSKPDSSDLCDLDGKSMMELFFSTPGLYSDDCEYLVGGPLNINGPKIITYDPINFFQFRDVYLDWISAASCYNRLKVGSNILVNLFALAGEQRFYKYTYGLLSAGGTLMTFIGQSMPASPVGLIRVYYDGSYFLFDYKTGNSSNQFTMSRYNLSGTSFIYVDDITFIPPAALSGYFFNSLQKASNGFYYLQIYLSSSELSITKYNPDGTYTGQDKRMYVTGFNKINMISIGGIIYLYYNNNDGSSPTFRKMTLF